MLCLPVAGTVVAIASTTSEELLPRASQDLQDSHTHAGLLRPTVRG
jgi:hypothetical protein